MKKTGKFLSISTILFLLFFSSWTPTYAQDRRGLEVMAKSLGGEYTKIGRQIVVFIAVDRYREWIPLKHPVNDAKSLKRILTDRYWIDEVKELYDDDATKAGVLRLFETLVTTTNPEDSVFIYYAGHGQLDTISDTGFWIPVDAGTDRYEQRNWIANAQIRNLIGKMKARHVALASDSCFSGDILNPNRAATPEITDEYFKNAYSRVSRQVLTSGSSESVPDDSPFSRQLELALEGNNKPYLDPLMLFTEIRLGVKGTTPLLGSLKDSGHQDGGSFLFFLKQDVAPAAQTPAKPPKVTVSMLTGHIVVKTSVPGTLFLDDLEIGTLVAGSQVRIDDVTIGDKTVTLRGADGKAERRAITVLPDIITEITFIPPSVAENALREADRQAPVALAPPVQLPLEPSMGSLVFPTGAEIQPAVPFVKPYRTIVFDGKHFDSNRFWGDNLNFADYLQDEYASDEKLQSLVSSYKKSIRIGKLLYIGGLACSLLGSTIGLVQLQTSDTYDWGPFLTMNIVGGAAVIGSMFTAFKSPNDMVDYINSRVGK